MAPSPTFYYKESSKSSGKCRQEHIFYISHTFREHNAEISYNINYNPYCFNLFLNLIL